MEPASPGEVPQAGVGWALLAFGPLALLALIVLALVAQPWPLLPVVRAIQASTATWIVVYSFLSIGQSLAFAIHVHRNERVPHRDRMGWVAAFAMFSSVAAPVYWFKGLTAPQE